MRLIATLETSADGQFIRINDPEFVHLQSAIRIAVIGWWDKLADQWDQEDRAKNRDLRSEEYYLFHLTKEGLNFWMRHQSEMLGDNPDRDSIPVSRMEELQKAHERLFEDRTT